MKFDFFKQKEILGTEELSAIHEERKFLIKKEKLEHLESAKMLAEERAFLGIL